MKVYSSEQQEIYAVSGQELRIHWDIKEVTINDQTQWEADEALCTIWDDRSTLIEKIIGSVYTPSAEFAMINNKDDKPEKYAEYQAFRTTAKSLADGWLATK